MTNEKLRQECEVYTRTCGYYRPMKQMNDAKQEEVKDRLYYKTNDKGTDTKQFSHDSQEPANSDQSNNE